MLDKNILVIINVSNLFKLNFLQIKIGNKSKMYDSDLLPIIELEIEELTSAIFSICNMLEEKYNWCA